MKLDRYEFKSGDKFLTYEFLSKGQKEKLKSQFSFHLLIKTVYSSILLLAAKTQKQVRLTTWLLLTIWLQLQKLNLKLLNTCKNIQSGREAIRNSLFEHGWIIEHDNKSVLIATSEGKFCDERLIIQYKEGALFWTAINHPGNHNALASQVCSMAKSKRLIAEIRTACA